MKKWISFNRKLNMQMDAEMLRYCFIGIVNRSGTVALQERWLQLLDMAGPQGALCGARPGPAHGANPWIWCFSFPLEVELPLSMLMSSVFLFSAPQLR